MMKYKWQILSLLMAITIVILAIFTFPNTCGMDSVVSPVETPAEVVDVQEEIYQSIMTRSSVRSYTGQRVDEEMVEKLLRAGMAAPTAGNRQPWAFYVVRDTNVIRQFVNVSKYTSPMAEHAQLAIVVAGIPTESFPDENRYWIQDVSAATENILLAAHSQGLGAVWCGVFPGEDRIAVLRDLLDVPEHHVPFNIIMIGYPNAEPVIKDKWKPEKVFYIK